MIEIEAMGGGEAALDALESLARTGAGVSGEASRGRRRRWYRLLVTNPFAGETLQPVVWVALAGRRPVGCLLGVPFRGRAGEVSLEGHWGVDLLVDPDFRGRGIGTRLLKQWRDSSPLALGLGITGTALRLELSLGWRQVPLPPRLVLPLTARGGLLARRCRRSPLPVARRGPGPSGLDVVVSTHGPRGLDQLYDRLAPGWPCHVCRTGAALRWRYASRWRDGFLWVSLLRRRTLVGAAVVRIDAGRWRTKMWIHELMADVTSTVLPCLVGECVRLGRSLDVDLVEGRVTGRALRAALSALGFRNGRREDTFIVHARDPAMARLRPWHREWFLTLGDSGNL